MRKILLIADFVLPFVPLLIIGQYVMDAYPLVDGERSWTSCLGILAVAAPLFAWGMYTLDRLTRQHR